MGSFDMLINATSAGRSGGARQQEATAGVPHVFRARHRFNSGTGGGVATGFEIADQAHGRIIGKAARVCVTVPYR